MLGAHAYVKIVPCRCRRGGAVDAARAACPPPAQAQTTADYQNYHRMSIDCQLFGTGPSARYACDFQTYVDSGFTWLAGTYITVSVLQQRLVATPSLTDSSWVPDPDAPEAYTALSKPTAQVHLLTTPTVSQVRFPQKVWTCIKDYAEEHEYAVTTDGAEDGSDASGMRCKNKHLKQRNGRYVVSALVDHCFDTPCPPIYTIKLNRGREFRISDVRGNRGLPHQRREGRSWDSSFANPYYSG